MIARIKDVRVAHGWATVDWVDSRGKSGSTSGSEDHPHMRALIARSLREMSPSSLADVPLPPGTRRA